MNCEKLQIDDKESIENHFDNFEESNIILDAPNPSEVICSEKDEKITVMNCTIEDKERNICFCGGCGRRLEFNIDKGTPSKKPSFKHPYFELTLPGEILKKEN